MSTYLCSECGEKIENLSDGLVVILRDEVGGYQDGVIVHKGECDDILCKRCKNSATSTNSSMEMTAFDNKESMEKYLKTGECPY